MITLKVFIQIVLPSLTSCWVSSTTPLCSLPLFVVPCRSWAEQWSCLLHVYCFWWRSSSSATSGNPPNKPLWRSRTWSEAHPQHISRLFGCSLPPLSPSPGWRTRAFPASAPTRYGTAIGRTDRTIQRTETSAWRTEVVFCARGLKIRGRGN